MYNFNYVIYDSDKEHNQEDTTTIKYLRIEDTQKSSDKWARQENAGQGVKQLESNMISKMNSTKHIQIINDIINGSKEIQWV